MESRSRVARKNLYHKCAAENKMTIPMAIDTFCPIVCVLHIYALPLAATTTTYHTKLYIDKPIKL